SSTDQRGFTTAYTYNAYNDLTTITDPTGAVTTNAWSGGELQSVEDANGNYTNYAYDGHRHVTMVTDALGGLTKFLYDGAGNATVVTDPMGRAVTTPF